MVGTLDCITDHIGGLDWRNKREAKILVNLLPLPVVSIATNIIKFPANWNHVQIQYCSMIGVNVLFWIIALLSLTHKTWSDQKCPYPPIKIWAQRGVGMARLVGLVCNVSGRFQITGCGRHKHIPPTVPLPSPLPPPSMLVILQADKWNLST